MLDYIKRKIREIISSKKSDSIPNWIDIREEVLPRLTPFNQRDIPACVAHSTVTMMQIQWYQQTGKMINFSPRFLDILSWTKDLDLNDGRDPDVVMNIAVNFGCCTEDLLPNDTTLPIEKYRDRKIITRAMFIEAAKYRMSNTSFIPKTLEEVDEIINQPSEELENYHFEIEQLRKKFSHNTLDFESKNELHIDNVDLIASTFDFFEQSKEVYEESPYVVEKKLENEIQEKYKEVIQKKNFFAKGVAARIDGFIFVVYSDDHDKHFHVIHKGRGVDARFSFPKIELLNYKNTRNFISSRETKKFREFLSRPEIFKKLEEEFEKRS